MHQPDVPRLRPRQPDPLTSGLGARQGHDASLHRRLDWREDHRSSHNGTNNTADRPGAFERRS